jgi:periplasmic protein TonB
MPSPPHDDSIPLTIVEFRATGLAGGGGGSAAAKLAAHKTAHVATRSAIVAVRHKVRQFRAQPFDGPIANHSDDEFEQVPEVSKIEVATKSAPVPGSPVRQGASNATADGTGRGVGGGNGSGNGVGSGSGSGGAYGNGGDGPQAVYAPAPTIPDDMRDEVMQVIAVARFQVSHDGTAKVTLLNPTEYSELNDIILDTLRRWRFKPALNNGVAIDSVADVRLLISVK